MAHIPKDCFAMGSPDDEPARGPDESPLHKVCVPTFELGKFEVTQEQWRAVMLTNPSQYQGHNMPVENVSWEDVQQFIGRLNRFGARHYRLPTEAEWEYAARAGTTGSYAGKLDDIAWYSGNSEDETHAVGTKKPNAWGLYDMEGNVREWVSDTYGANYYANSPAADPSGPAPGQGGRGGPGGRGGRGGGPGGPGVPGGPDAEFGAGAPPAPPCPGPENPQIKDLQQQIDCLRQQLADLTQQFQQGPRGAGPGGPGGPPPGRGQGPGLGAGRGGPGGPGGNLPVMRGGGWDNLENFLRVSSRYNYYGPTLRVSDVGFRVAREPIAR
jgi:formylglycine-generating enzyme required for sulfatase activity